MPTSTQTNQLASIFQAGRHFQFLQKSHELLAKLPHAPELAAMSVEALATLGYGGPARELIQRRADIGGPLGLQNQLNDSLSKLPNGRVSWNELKETYQRNVQAFIARYPHHQGTLERAEEDLKKIHLFRSQTGRFHMSRREPGQMREWIGDLGVEPSEIGVQLPDKGPIHVPVIVGVSLGSLINRVCELTQNAFLTYNHPVFVVETNPQRFIAWMHCADHTELFKHEHVEWFIGKDAIDDFSQHLRHNDPIALPQLVLNQSANVDTTAEIQAQVLAVENSRRDSLDSICARLEDLYEAPAGPEHANRLTPPNRVLALTSRYTTMLQYSTRDVLDALDHKGFETQLLIEQQAHHCLTPNTICKTIEEFKPNLLIILDHMRREYPFIPANLPMLTWIQDPLPDLLCKEAGQSVKAPDFVCGLFRDRCIEQFDYPKGQFEYVDVPVSTRIFHDAEPSAAHRKRFECDISFVSNASTPIEEFHEAELQKGDPSVHEFMNVLFEATKKAIDDDAFCLRKAIELTTRIATEMDLDLTEESTRTFATHYTYRVFDWGRRQRTLEWVSKWANRTNRTFKIFGRGWENHPTLSPHAAGVVEHGQDLRDVYRSSTLSLQLIPSGFHHQRSFEIIASGSLPLTRFCEGDFGDLPATEFQALRDAGKFPEVIPNFPRFREIVFTSPKDFETQAESFLKNTDRRQAVLKELQECVQERFTYDAAINRVLSAFRNHLRSI
ncbi:MAG: hypothetical protein DHS20C16_23910 [Phycisphaerae bacterium]|nr:MAG: hypothetical protein DHS20C16_23910 [Phycisphaerae bacterium]